MKSRFHLPTLLSGIIFAIIAFLLFAPISIGLAAFAAIAITLMTLGVIPMPSGVLGANYAASALAKGQAKLIQNFQSGELRIADPVTYKAFLKNAEIMMPSHKMLRTREDRAIEAYYIQRSSRALGTGRNYNATGVTGVSGVLTPSWATYNDPFSLSLKQADNNMFTYDEMMARQVENSLKNFMDGNESTAVTYLFNNKSAINAAVAEGTFNAPNTTFELIESNVGNRAIQITEGAMVENKWGGFPLTVFCDSVSYNKFAFLSKQGIENAVNTSFQFEGKTFVRSLGLTAKAAALNYTKGYWIAVPDGTIGLLDWIPVQNRNGVDKLPYKYSSFLNPMDGLNYAVFQWYIAQDSTATGGYTQDVLDQFEFSIDLAFENAPLSTATETSIQAFALI